MWETAYSVFLVTGAAVSSHRMWANICQLREIYTEATMLPDKFAERLLMTGRRRALVKAQSKLTDIAGQNTGLFKRAWEIYDFSEELVGGQSW